MTTPIIYRSTDASAPVLTGANASGKLTGVLDACLVNGYGSKAAAGWTKAFSATNNVDYRPAAGNQFYLDVNDTATGLPGGNMATVSGYEAMTALNTGTHAFNSGTWWHHSGTNDGTARPWVVAADDRTVYVFVSTGGATYVVYGFGDFYSFRSADAYRTFLCSANSQTANANATAGSLDYFPGYQSNQSSTVIARTSLGTGAGVAVSVQACGMSATTIPYPNLPDNNLYCSRLLLLQAGSSGVPGIEMRGYLRGLYNLFQYSSAFMNDGDTFSGSGDFAGRTFQLVGLTRGASNFMAVETTAWDTSS